EMKPGAGPHSTRPLPATGMAGPGAFSCSGGVTMVSLGAPSGSRRILALWLPRLSTDRLQRGAPELLPGGPLVVFDKIDNALRLTAVDRAASAVELSVGMTLADARARVPGLVAKPADAEADHALLGGIADWCDRYTPFVACHPPRALLLDITGGA